jgi:hypothetical protein
MSPCCCLLSVLLLLQVAAAERRQEGGKVLQVLPAALPRLAQLAHAWGDHTLHTGKQHTYRRSTSMRVWPAQQRFLQQRKCSTAGLPAYTAGCMRQAYRAAQGPESLQQHAHPLQHFADPNIHAPLPSSFSMLAVL